MARASNPSSVISTGVGGSVLPGVVLLDGVLRSLPGGLRRFRGRRPSRASPPEASFGGSTSFRAASGEATSARRGTRDDLRRVRVGPAVVEVAVRRREGSIRQVVEVLALRIEDRQQVAEVPARGLGQLRRRRVVEEERLVAGGRGARPGDPAGVGRPREAEVRQRVVAHPRAAAVDLDGNASVGADHVDRAPVRRRTRAASQSGDQCGPVAEARPELRQRALCSRAVGRPDGQFVLAATVAPVRHQSCRRATTTGSARRRPTTASGSSPGRARPAR